MTFLASVPQEAKSIYLHLGQIIVFFPITSYDQLYELLSKANLSTCKLNHFLYLLIKDIIPNIILNFLCNINFFLNTKSLLQCQSNTWNIVNVKKNFNRLIKGEKA